MKRTTLCHIFFLLLGFTLQSQSTFSYRLTFDRPVPTVLTSIEVTDSCFYVCGVTNDTLPPYQLGSLFGKMSFEGEILWYKALVDPNKYIGTWQNTLIPTEDGNFMVTAQYADSVCLGALLIKYNSSGDTLFTRKYISPYAPENNFIYFTGARETNDGGYLLITNVTDPNPFNSNIYVLKTDSIGMIEWDNFFSNLNFSQISISGNYKGTQNIIGGQLTNSNIVNQGYIARTQLIQIDSQGNLEWEYLSPAGELGGFAYDVLPTNDGGYLVASGKGFEVGQSTNTILQWHNYVFKLDADRNFEWGVDIRNSLAQGSNQLTKLIEVSDDSGYITVGRIYEPNIIENGWDYHGIIAKISKEGDSLWTRYYNHVMSPADDHIFYDVEETPDGGFVMVGQATDFNQATGESPLQRAWIVKVDEHGCLVPGCHLTSSTIDLHDVPFQLTLYPNPVSPSNGDYLNVYFYHPKLKSKAIFQLTDVSGKVLLEFESTMGDVTHMVPVSNLVSGSYWLSCRVREDVVTKQVVVQ